MTTFKIRPITENYNTVKEFLLSQNINENDVLISSRSTFKGFIEPLNLNFKVIFPANFGKGEPTSLMIDEIMKEIPKNAKRIYAIGGGSVIDISKLLILDFDGSTSDLFMGRTTAKKVRELITVPTTCGTGSEATAVSICELIEEKTKKGLALEEMFPDKAVLVPELLENLPYDVFATSSIDALIHAAESFLSPKACMQSELFSIEAIKMIISSYLYIKDNGKDSWKHKKEDLLIASNYAGIAFANAGVGAVHALSYPLGATYHIPHGEVNAMMFLSVFKTYEKRNPLGKFKAFTNILADLLGVSNEKALDELSLLLDFILKTKKLSSFGADLEKISEFSDSVLLQQQRLLANNYVELSFDEILSIYKEVL